MEIILATQSPRRVQVMKTLGLEFKTIPSNFDEDSIVEKDTGKLVEILALEKARTIAKLYPEALVIGADSLLEVQGEVVGKPKDLADAKRMLLKGSGKTNFQFVGLAVIYKGVEKSTSLQGEAKMKTYGEAEIEDYFTRINPLDKAGGFAGDPAEGGEFLERYIGEPGEELGLPKNSLKKFLKEFGVEVS